MNILELPIEQTGLSVRSLNALHRYKVHTIGQMLEQTEESLSQKRNLGTKSITEILTKIAEVRTAMQAGENSAPAGQSEEMEETAALLEEQGYTIDDLQTLSPKAFNILSFNGQTALSGLAAMSWEELMQIPRMDSDTANEILIQCRKFCQKLSRREEKPEPNSVTLDNVIRNPRYHDALLRFAEANDVPVAGSILSNRSTNQLQHNGYHKLSQCLFLTGEDLSKLRNLGAVSIKEILSWRDRYLEKHEKQILAFCGGDESVLRTGETFVALPDEGEIRELILRAYQEIGFGGLSLREMRDYLKLPEEVPDETLKKTIGGLLAAGELEYVDFRCYRVYPKFSDYVRESGILDERACDILERRLQGETLEAISQGYDMTRERVRQVSSKSVRILQNKYHAITGLACFDEDYYRYLFENYELDRKDAEQWLGIRENIWNYLLMTDAKKGKQPLSAAAEDPKLDAGLRLKIRNYLNRNKIFVDDIWIEKRRANIEEYVIRKYCKDEVSYEEFIQIYNRFLEEQDIPYDEDIYYTDAVLQTRKNKLSGADFVLWKYGERIRYYDIVGRDFDELLDELSLDSYQNTEITTTLLFQKHPEIMEKYDIRDEYELHQLLKIIVPEGSYHDFHCERMPNLQFGKFNRDEAIRKLLLEHAPISAGDFLDLIYQEFGYKPGAFAANYLPSFSVYLNHGVYDIKQKAMPAENMQKLKDALQDDFYYLDEIRERYAELVPDADLSEINSYNLKRMGFQVLSRYVLQHYDSLEAYFRDLLTAEEITDIAAYRKRFSEVGMFSQTLWDLRRSYDILEFEPDQMISIHRLERAGVTREDLQEFCDQVYEYIEPGKWFSAKSLRDSGFYSDLYELGFSDCFYAGILAADPRFSFGKMLSNTLLIKGEHEVSIRAFLSERIREHRSIDIYDLISEVENDYGCRVPDRNDVIYKVQGTEIYYDGILERFYANEELYYREIDGAGGRV